MSEGPDFTRIAALIGEPARANMLTALLDGRALTARELAEAGGVTPATASGHLAQMAAAGLLWPRQQGRHRYYALADAEVAHALETLAGLAATRGHLRSRPGPADARLRAARVCYDHLAGSVAVAIFDSLAERGCLSVAREAIVLTQTGQSFAASLGIDIAALRTSRRPVVRACLDWSERRTHLAGGLGAALLDAVEAQGWVRRARAGRHVDITEAGRAGLARAFGIEAPLSAP